MALVNAPPAPGADQALASSTRWVDGADGRHGAGARLAESHLAISGMWCAACAPTIEDALCRVAGVRDARVSAAAARAVVRWDPAHTGLGELVAAVQRAGYRALPDGEAAPPEQRLRESRLALWRFFVAAFCSMQVMMFLTPSYVSAPGELDDDMRRLLAWGAWCVSLPVLAFAAAPFFAGAWRSLRQRRIGMDVPVALGLAVTFVASTAAMVDPGGPFGAEVYFDSLTMFVAFLIGARWFETRVRHRAAAWLEDALQRLPDTARRVRDDGEVEMVPAHRLAVGDRLRVPLGERFAADGVLIDGPSPGRCEVGPAPWGGSERGERGGTGPPPGRSEGGPAPLGGSERGERGGTGPPPGRSEGGPAPLGGSERSERGGTSWTEVDEAILTGESRPVSKMLGADVLAGSINLGRVVDVRVRAVGPDTRQAGIVALMRDAAMQRPDAVRLADRWAAPFLWVVLVLAAGSALVWSFVEPSRAVWVAVSVLIVTCPCALSLAVPSAQLAATGYLARHGLLLRRIEALEVLARVGRVAFDKTGTLTHARGRLQLIGDATDEAALRRAWRVAVSLAQASTHPVSRAIVDAARSIDARSDDLSAPAGKDRPVSLHDIREVRACGMVGIDDAGVEWRLGSRAWAIGGPPADHAEPGIAWLAARGDGVTWRFAADGEVLRAGAHNLGAALAASGVDLAIVSGDEPARVQAIADRVGAHIVVAAADPERKLAVLRGWQQQGIVVAMVGDGVNDAPVIAQADVSIAMGEGASVTQGEADAVLVGTDLCVLPRAVVQARRCVRVVRQNLAWAAAYNLACIPLAMFGWLPPWAAGLGMAASSLAVIVNAQRLAR